MGQNTDKMTMTTKNINTDPMGQAIADYWTSNGKNVKTLELLSPDFDDDEFPVEELFRAKAQMPMIEQKALDITKGRTLDVGAGAGCHSLALQEMGLSPTAIDISQLSVDTMTKRGVRDARVQDFWTVSTKYDTILMLMNGTGIIGSVDRLGDFFRHLDNILAKDGQLLIDSSDLCYLFENEDGSMDIPIGGKYYGELEYTMRYGNILGKPFPWLYLDFDNLAAAAEEYGFRAEIVAEGEHYDYLARIVR